MKVKVGCLECRWGEDGGYECNGENWNFTKKLRIQKSVMYKKFAYNLFYLNRIYEITRI